MPVKLTPKKLNVLNTSVYKKPFINDNPAYTVYADSVLNANKDKNFVKRYLYPDNYPAIQTNKLKGYESMPNSESSTHLMGHDPNTKRVYPSIVQLPNGQLKYLEDDAAWDYADRTGEYIQFKTAQEAANFASDGYKRGNQYLKKKK